MLKDYILHGCFLDLDPNEMILTFNLKMKIWTIQN